MTDRLAYAQARLLEGDDCWANHFDIDEKWFYAHSQGQKCKIPPGHTRPKMPLQSKRHIPKVMFLAATALPRPGFNGKIAFIRICKMRTAKKKSKYHQKGDRYEVDVPMDADKYLEIMVKKVFPAARSRMPWAKSCAASKMGRRRTPARTTSPN